MEACTIERCIVVYNHYTGRHQKAWYGMLGMEVWTGVRQREIMRTGVDGCEGMGVWDENECRGADDREQ